MKVNMISKTEHEYPFGVKLKPGDRFEAESDEDAKLLALIGRAEPETLAQQYGRKSARRNQAASH